MILRTSAAYLIALTSLIGLPLGVPATAGSTLYGLLSTGEMYASQDGGVTWVMRSILPARDAVALIAGKTSWDLSLITISGEVYRSSDAGVDWNYVGSLGANDVVDIAVNRDGALLALSQTGMLSRSVDEGTSWQVIATMAGRNFVSLTGLQNGHVLALTGTGEVWDSSDGGVQWNLVAVASASNAVDIRGLKNEIHILTSTGEVLQSVDVGLNWIPVGTLSHVGMCGLALTQTGLAAATEQGEVAVSVDGASWAWIGTMNQVWVTTLASDVTIRTSTSEHAGFERWRLGTPRPNPGSGTSTTIFPVDLTGRATIQLRLFDLRGRKVSESASRVLDGPGSFFVPWRPGKLVAGVYFVQLDVDSSPVASSRWVVLE